MALNLTQLEKVRDVATKLRAEVEAGAYDIGLLQYAEQLETMLHVAEVDKAIEDLYRETADRLHGKDGECEIDDDAVVSVSDDRGAYVQAWVWVYDTDTGRPCCDDCGCLLVDAADEFMSCPECEEMYRVFDGVVDRCADDDMEAFMASPRMKRAEMADLARDEEAADRAIAEYFDPPPLTNQLGETNG